MGGGGGVGVGGARLISGRGDFTSSSFLVSTMSLFIGTLHMKCTLNPGDPKSDHKSDNLPPVS